MTLDCNNIDLKKGSTGDVVKELQQILKDKGYYDGKLDGDYGDLTVSAVKRLQKALGVKEDGEFGPVSCKAYKNSLVDTTKTTTTQTTTSSVTKTVTNNTGVYKSSPHWTGSGCNKLGQCTSYYCGPHSLHQCLCKFGIEDYTEKTLAGWAGTTTSGTGHSGINTAVAMVNKKQGTNIKIEWKYFSDLGETTAERFKELGKLIEQEDKDCIIHSLYRNKWGHYETIKAINTKDNTVTVLNSLGNKSTSTAYKGYIETRSFSTFAQYIANNNAGQPSIGLITKQ